MSNNWAPPTVRPTSRAESDTQEIDILEVGDTHLRHVLIPRIVIAFCDEFPKRGKIRTLKKHMDFPNGVAASVHSRITLYVPDRTDVDVRHPAVPEHVIIDHLAPKVARATAELMYPRSKDPYFRDNPLDTHQVWSYKDDDVLTVGEYCVRWASRYSQTHMDTVPTNGMEEQAL